MMKEEMDQFERSLSRQPLRQIPAGWREEILAAATGRGSRVESREQERPRPSPLVARLSTLLWPHPAAWAGLAAVWIFIFTLNVSTLDQSPVVAVKSAPPSPEMIVELKQQQRLLAELIGPRDAPEADRSKPLVPRPRTEHGEFMAA